MRRLLQTLTVLALAAGALPAQGGLGTQGYGYPTGQLGSSSLGMGGANAEIDPATPINPAAVVTQARYSIYMQFEPEFRRTSVPGDAVTSSTFRFPNFVGTGGFRRFVAGLSFSTLLDRTWANTYSDSQVVGGTTYPSTLNASSTGAMNDTRFAIGYFVGERLQVGAAVHAISGENRLAFGRTFPAETGIGGVQQQSTINFAGRAFSLGAVGQPIPGLLLGASARFGGPLDAERDGSFLAEATVPSRYGLSAAWLRIPSTTLAARYERTAWSDLAALGSAQMTTFDATELGLGVDVLGPRVGGAPTTWRLGFRDRTLPFGLDGDQVDERALSGGVSVPISRGRGQVDLTVLRANRSAGGYDERSWFLALGLGIRP